MAIEIGAISQFQFSPEESLTNMLDISILMDPGMPKNIQKNGFSIVNHPVWSFPMVFLWFSYGLGYPRFPISPPSILAPSITQPQPEMLGCGWSATCTPPWRLVGGSTHLSNTKFVIIDRLDQIRSDQSILD